MQLVTPSFTVLVTAPFPLQVAAYCGETPLVRYGLHVRLPWGRKWLCYQQITHLRSLKFNRILIAAQLRSTVQRYQPIRHDSIKRYLSILIVVTNNPSGINSKLYALELVDIYLFYTDKQAIYFASINDMYYNTTYIGYTHFQYSVPIENASSRICNLLFVNKPQEY